MTLHLNHIHLPKLTPYIHASTIQQHYVCQHLHHKAYFTTRPTPNPVLLTFQTPPTYTCGRREIGTLSPAQIATLRYEGRAEFHEALRGGQTTFHGPGQLTAYLICSLQSHNLSPRKYVRLLETSVIDTCRRYGLWTYTTKDNPGVWIKTGTVDGSVENKIASVGVHLRRNVASHGIGLNVSTDLAWFRRITACGLPGNLVTSVMEQVGKQIPRNEDGSHEQEKFCPLELEGEMQFTRASAKDVLPKYINEGDMPPSLGKVANDFAQAVAKNLQGVDGRVEKAWLDRRIDVRKTNEAPKAL